MTLVSRPGSHEQAAWAVLDAGAARDIALMLGDARTVLDWPASADAPPSAARQAAAVLADTDSPYDLPGLAGAVGETAARLHLAARSALAHIPEIPS